MRSRAVVISTVVVIGIAILSWQRPRGELWAQQPSIPSGIPYVKPLVLSDGLIAVSSDTADGKQQVAVIDTKARVMSVYHIDHASGAISLKSVRNITADLTLDEFNTTSPSPQEIRAMKNTSNKR